MLNTGKASREQIQGWVANRFYYQIIIPQKDAAVMSNAPTARCGGVDPAHPRPRRPRGRPGRHRAWMRLGEAVGLAREEIVDQRHVIPAVRFACDAYLNFCRQRPWRNRCAPASPKLFAPTIHKQRLASWPEHCPWIESEGLQYFRNRVTQARRDVEQGLAITLAYFDTRAAAQGPGHPQVQARHPVVHERRDGAALWPRRWGEVQNPRPCRSICRSDFSPTTPCIAEHAMSD